MVKAWRLYRSRRHGSERSEITNERNKQTMSKSIDKDLKSIENCFKGFFKDLDTIALNIAAINKTRANMEATGNYTYAYIEDVLEKEKTAKASSRSAPRRQS